MNKTQLLQGTLDLLILRILDLGPNHGWGIANRPRRRAGTQRRPLRRPCDR